MSQSVYKILEESAKSRPDITGVQFVKYKREPTLYLSKLISRARYVESLPLSKRSTNDRMEIAAWNITWRCFKRTRPGLAKMLQDPDFKAFVKAFNADISIEI